MLPWFLSGWLGCTFAGFLTHVEDACPLYWASPVTYHDTAYYGREFFLANHSLMLLTMPASLVARLRRGKKREAGTR